MRTQCLTAILDNEQREICVLYREYDGYPTGHGDELKDFLQGFTLVNGLSGDATLKIANDMGCLAAQVVAHFKKGPGGFYLHPAGARDRGEEYIYTVYRKENQIMLRVQGRAITYFGLPGTKQQNMPVLYDGAVEWFDPERVEKDWRENGLSNLVNDLVDEQILSSDTFEVLEDSRPSKN